MWLALFTGLTFVGYFSPIRELLPTLSTPSDAPWRWFWVQFYAGATCGNAGFLREQMCKFMCPYARFQSALIDMDSLVIAYAPHAASPVVPPARARPTTAAPAWAIVSTAPCACRSARPASTSAMACRTPAAPAVRTRWECVLRLNTPAGFGWPTRRHHPLQLYGVRKRLHQDFDPEQAEMALMRIRADIQQLPPASSGV